MEHLLCTIDGLSYGISLERALQVLAGERMYLLPLLPQEFDGVVLWKGEAVPVLHSNRRTHMKALVIADTKKGRVAIQVEKTPGIERTIEGRSDILLFE